MAQFKGRNTSRKERPIKDPNLTDEGIATYLKFFHWADEQPADTIKPMAGH